MKSSILLSIAFLFLNLQQLHAQSLYLKGVVIDAKSKETIPFATITAYNINSIINGVSTTENGTFNLKITKKTSHLEISFIGYQTKKIEIVQINDKKNIRIELITTATQLNEVEITAKRTTTRVKIDRKIIDFGFDIQQSGVNALEAFDQIGEIETNQTNGTISLRGSDQVRVLIDGKPSSLSATELLKQLPVSKIKQVEIITSPSIKYKAQGLSGIINIKLKRNRSEGLNLLLNNSVGIKRHGFGLQTNYNHSNMNFRLNGSYNKSATRDDQFINREFISGKKEHIYTPNLFDGNVLKTAIGFDYYIKDKHEFTFEIDYTKDMHDYNNASQYLDRNGNFEQLFLRTTKHTHYNTIYQANYRLNMAADNTHFLEVDYNMNLSKNGYPQTDSIDGNEVHKKHLNEDYKLHSFAIDYTVPIKEKGGLETGISLNTQALKSSQELYTEHVSDIFSYKEQLFGVYGLVNYSFDKLNFKGGLRYEHFNATSKNSSVAFNTKQSYNNVFPSIHASYLLNEKSTLHLGYSKRISRPNFHHVNAFQLYSPFFTWIYNPNIIPEISHNIDLSYHKSGVNYGFSFTTFYRQRKDVILWIASSENNQQKYTYENSGGLKSYGIESNFRYQVLPFWHATLSANYYRNTLIMKNVVPWKNTYSSSYQIKNMIKIYAKLNLDVTYMHRPKSQRNFSYLENRSRLDIAFKRIFFKGRLATSLRFVNVLQGNVFDKTTQTNTFSQNTVWEMQQQNFNFLLNLNYQLFNDQKKKRTKKQRSHNKIEID